MFISKEEHDGNRVVEFVHFVEVGDLIDIAEVDDCKVLDLFGDTVEDFVLSHAVGIPVASKADNYETVFFGHDGLIDVPASLEVGENDGSHGDCGVVVVVVMVVMMEVLMKVVFESGDLVEGIGVCFG